MGRLVGCQPGLRLRSPVVQCVGAAPDRHFGPVERDVLHRAEPGAAFHQRTVAERLVEVVCGEPAGAEARPQHQAGTRGHGGRQIHLQPGQVPDDRQQVGRPGHVEKLGPHGDPPGLATGQLLHSSIIAPRSDTISSRCALVC